MNLKNIRLAEKRPDGTRHYHVIPIGGDIENRQIHQEEKKRGSEALGKNGESLFKGYIEFLFRIIHSESSSVMAVHCEYIKHHRTV